MSAEAYLQQVKALVARIESTQRSAIRQAALHMAGSIAAGRAVHLFGSGHSVIPVLDIFPRYGSFVGFHPIMDPRLMWWNVVGPGGARELLWLERTEGYVANVLLSYHLDSGDTMLVFSHGGLNAAPVEMALSAKKQGLVVVAVTSVANRRISRPTHSSGNHLADAADIVIDNCVDAEDAAVPIAGRPEKVAALSTVAAVTISMALVAEVGRELAAQGVDLSIFVSPNVAGVAADHNRQVFSHGGLNAAPVEMALAAREQGLVVVAVTSVANRRISRPTHSSGNHLADVADVVIDNCVDAEDAAVPIAGRPEKVAALSTVAAITISMALVAEVGRELAAQGVDLSIFVSPNVPGVAADHNRQVFQEYTSFIRHIGDPTA